MKKQRTHLKDLSLAALLTAVLVLSSFLCIPVGDGRISLQFLAVLLIGGLLPMKYALLSILSYLTLGALGLPVFAGFGAGLGVLFGPTGGFLLGFLPSVLVFDLLCRKKRSFPSFLVSGLLALSCCYLSGSVWYLIYLPEHSLLTTLSVCILPYLLPDLLKILLASLVLCALKGRRISSRQDAD